MENEPIELKRYERRPKIIPAQKVKILIDAFIANGGTLEQIKKGTQIYTDIKNTSVILSDGRRATMEEKFILAGYKRRPRRTVSFAEIQQRLHAYVDAGGDLSDLGVNDELYKLVKNYDSVHTLEEKFAMFGFTRKTQKSQDSLEDLKRMVFEYLANGNSLHIERKKLPFYEKLNTVRKKHFRKYGVRISNKEILESIGVKGYSDIYYGFIRLFDLKNHQDENGNVDSYRKNLSLNATIDRYAELLDMPVSLVVLLVADQNLEKSYLQTDTLSFISKQLQDFKQRNHNSYQNISTLEPQLYHRLTRLKKIVKTDSGRPVSTKELVAMLYESDHEDVFFDNTEIQEPTYDRDIAPLIELAKLNDNKISAKNIDRCTYRMLLDYVTRKSTTLTDLFAEYGITYVDSRVNSCFVKLSIDKFPYIDEMRFARDSIMHGIIENNPQFTSEEIFEKHIEVCKAVYQEFKPLIEAYGLNEDFDSSKLRPTTFDK